MYTFISSVSVFNANLHSIPCTVPTPQRFGRIPPIRTVASNQIGTSTIRSAVGSFECISRSEHDQNKSNRSTFVSKSSLSDVFIAFDVEVNAGFDRFLKYK